MPFALLTANYNTRNGEYDNIYLDDPTGLITAQLSPNDFKAKKDPLSPQKLCISPMRVLNIAEECGFELQASPSRLMEYHISTCYSWHLHKPAGKG
ncbi:unnamed protein product, partial [Mesorhabditis spiculigera]